MAALEAFCRGAGIPATKLDDKQLAETMQRLGQVMPSQPLAPNALLNSGEKVFQLAKRSSDLILGSVSLRKARTSPRSCSASGGK